MSEVRTKSVRMGDLCIGDVVINNDVPMVVAGVGGVWADGKMAISLSDQKRRTQQVFDLPDTQVTLGTVHQFQTYRTSTHTPEPWSWVPSPLYHGYEGPLGKVVGGDGSTICDFGNCTQYYQTEGAEPNDADMGRMLACVNAMTGVADPESFVKAAMRFEALDCCTGYSIAEAEWPAFWAALEELRDAIAKAKGVK